MCRELIQDLKIVIYIHITYIYVFDFAQLNTLTQKKSGYNCQQLIYQLLEYELRHHSASGVGEMHCGICSPQEFAQRTIVGI